ncbi:MAG: hypothetical protein Q7R76_00245 [Candidatus Woesearchaeota archaeon]|nr:hypothetical protein [Candidatus Woesearchaeota archaeon]
MPLPQSHKQVNLFALMRKKLHTTNVFASGENSAPRKTTKNLKTLHQVTFLLPTSHNPVLRWS